MSKLKLFRMGWYALLRRTLGTVGVVVSVAGLLGPALADAAPAISGIAASQITTTSAVISWQTDVPSDSYISYVAANSTDSLFAEDQNMVTSHSVTLSGLAPATTYSFTVNSADSQGDNAALNGTDFTTSSSGQTVSPNPPAPVPVLPSASTANTSGSGLAMPSGLTYAELLAVYGPRVTMPLYPTGTLAKESGAIFFLMGKDQVKIPFTSMEAFTGLGYSLQNVQTLDISSFRLPASGYSISDANQQHPWGQVVSHNGTLYYSHMTGMIAIPSMDIFTANGFKSEWVVPMNAADVEVLTNYPVMYPLEANDDRIL